MELCSIKMFLSGFHQIPRLWIWSTGREGQGCWQLKCDVRLSGKMSRLLFNEYFFSNPGDKVLIHVECRVEIFHLVFTHLGHCPLDWRTTIQLNVVLNFLHRPWHIVFLENCEKITSVYESSLIKGTMSQLLLKLYVVRISAECD